SRVSVVRIARKTSRAVSDQTRTLPSRSSRSSSTRLRAGLRRTSFVIDRTNVGYACTDTKFCTRLFLRGIRHLIQTTRRSALFDVSLSPNGARALNELATSAFEPTFHRTRRPSALYFRPPCSPA